MAKIKINKDKCKGCFLCIMACPNACIKVDKTKLSAKGYFTVNFINNGKCTGCKFCAMMCPDTAIEIFK